MTTVRRPISPGITSSGDEILLWRSLSEKSIRSDSLHLKHFWSLISTLNIAEDGKGPLGDLISAAYDFVLAYKLQKNAAEFRKRLAVHRQEKKANLKIGALKKRLADAMKCPTLRGRFPVDALRLMEQFSRALLAAEQSDSQTQIHRTIRADSVEKMGKAMIEATGKPHWELISIAVLLASGEKEGMPSPDDLRKEYRRCK